LKDNRRKKKRTFFFLLLDREVKKKIIPWRITFTLSLLEQEKERLNSRGSGVSVKNQQSKFILSKRKIISNFHKEKNGAFIHSSIRTCQITMVCFTWQQWGAKRLDGRV